MPIVHFFVFLLVMVFIVTVTVGDDLELLFARIWDLFHPTDRELRRAYSRTRTGDSIMD